MFNSLIQLLNSQCQYPKCKLRVVGWLEPYSCAEPLQRGIDEREQ